MADVTIPDGTVLAAGQSFSKVWRIKNTGGNQWDANQGYSWTFDGGDRMGGPDAVAVAATSPGATTDVAVSLAAPATPGTYQGYWRMQGPEGTKFGVRAYVKIVVKGVSSQPDGARFVADVTVPDGTTFGPTAPFRKTWRITNTGGNAWDPARGYRWTFDGGDQMGGHTPIAAIGTGPGQTWDVAVDMGAPASPGSYQGYWRMQGPGGGKFGDRVWVKIVVKGSRQPDGARFVADVTVPDGTVIAPSAAFTKVWRIKNTGANTWDSAAGYQWTFDGGDQMGGPNTVSVPPIPPGGTWDVSVALHAPAAAGDFRGYWRMQSPDGTKFGDRVWVQISVSSPPGGPQVDWYDQNGKNQWTNDPNREVVRWGIAGAEHWGQAWDAVPNPNPGFTTHEGYLTFGYIENEDARQGWHRARLRAVKDGRDWDFSSEPYGFDSRAPTVALTGGPAPGAVLKALERVVWHIDDPHSGIKHWGQAWDDDPGPMFTTFDGWLETPEGTHVLNIHTWDNLDNNKNWTFGPFTVLPPPPSNLTAVQGVGQVALSWSDNSRTEDGFAIDRMPRGGSFSQIGTVGANITSYNDSSGTPGETYTYRVRAFTDKGSSDPSNEVSVSVTPTQPCPTPTSYSVSFGDQTLGTSGSALTCGVLGPGSGCFGIVNTSGHASMVSARITGTNASDFVIVSNSCSGTEAPGASCYVSISFAPTALGTRTATLEVVGDGCVQITWQLTGNGLAPSPVCPSGQKFCSGQCIDVTSDSRNCGACDRICTDSDGHVTECCNGVCCAYVESCCHGTCCYELDFCCPTGCSQTPCGA